MSDRAGFGGQGGCGVGCPCKRGIACFNNKLGWEDTWVWGPWKFNNKVGVDGSVLGGGVVPRMEGGWVHGSMGNFA